MNGTDAGGVRLIQDPYSVVEIGEGCTKAQRTLRLDLNVGVAEVH